MKNSTQGISEITDFEKALVSIDFTLEVNRYGSKEGDIVANTLYVNSQDWLMQRLQPTYVQLIVEVKCGYIH